MDFLDRPMQALKTIIRLAALAATASLATACGSFGKGFLTGLAQYGTMIGSYTGSPAPRVQSASASPRNGSLDYLLDPNYAIAQTVAQQQQWNQVNEAIMRTSIQQVQTKEELEYLEFCRYNKKADGSDYTKDEWRAMQGQALAALKSGSTAAGTSSAASQNVTGATSSGSTASRRRCTKMSATDIAHCNGSGTCQKCNGKGRYYDTSFGNGRWVTPCTICGGNGKCPSCRGTGYR